MSCVTIILGLVALDFSNAFSLKKSEPETPLVVKEGESFRLSCEVDNYYEYCKFVHTDKMCDFEWKRFGWNITVRECKDYKSRMEWSGNYDYYECAMTISNAQLEDAGAWKCEVESYAFGKYRGYGNKVTADFDIEFIAKTTNTTTTTTAKIGQMLETLPNANSENTEVENDRATKLHCRQNMTFFDGVDIRFTIHRHERNTGKMHVLSKYDFGLVTNQITDEQGFKTQTFSEMFYSSDSEVIYLLFSTTSIVNRQLLRQMFVK